MHLQQSFPARFQFVKRRFVRLFNKDMKDNDSSPLDCTVKSASDPFPADSRISNSPSPRERVMGIPKLGPWIFIRSVILA